jgi:AcrR family transcriptional regulator
VGSNLHQTSIGLVPLVKEQLLCYCVGMARPRVHDPDVVLDAAESLAVGSGPGAVTIRAVATAAGVSNGAIYHTFESRAVLLGRTWLRAAGRFLAVQTDLVDAALTDANRVAAVVAAADALVVFAERFPQSARLLMVVSRDQLIGADGSDSAHGVTAELTAVDRALVESMIRLSLSLWDRRDAAAVDVITTCVVDLPTAVLLTRNRIDNPTAREQLREAVRAVLEVGPPPLPERHDRSRS